MRVQDLIIGILIFSLFMVVILGFAYQTYSDMGVTLDNQTATALSAFETNAKTTQTNMYGVVVDMQNNSIGGSNAVADSSKTYGDNVIGTGIRVVTIGSRSFSIINGLMNVMTNSLGIDPIFQYTFYAIIVVIIIMIFASSVLYNRL